MGEHLNFESDSQRICQEVLTLSLKELGGKKNEG